MGRMTDRASARAAQERPGRPLRRRPRRRRRWGWPAQDTEYVVRVDLTEAGAGIRVPRDVDGVRVVTHVIGTVRPL